MRKSLAARFMEKVKIRKDNCWDWAGYKDKDGYGYFKLSKAETRAHRASYLIFKGPITKGMVIMHLCSNRFCTNPSHLKEGSQAENIQDASRKERLRGQKNYKGKK